MDPTTAYSAAPGSPHGLPQEKKTRRGPIIAVMLGVCAVAMVAMIVVKSGGSSSSSSDANKAHSSKLFDGGIIFNFGSCPMAPAKSDIQKWAEQLVEALPQGQPSKGQLVAGQDELGVFGRFFHTTSPGCVENAKFRAFAPDEILRFTPTEETETWEETKRWLVFTDKRYFLNTWEGSPISDAERSRLVHGIFRETDQDLDVTLRWSNAKPGPNYEQGDQRGLAIKFHSPTHGEQVDRSVEEHLGLTDIARHSGLEEELEQSVYHGGRREQDIIMSTTQFFLAKNDEVASNVVTALATGSNIMSALASAIGQGIDSITGESQNIIKLVGDSNDSGNVEKNGCSADAMTATYFSQAASRLGPADSALNDISSPLSLDSTFVRYKLAPCESVCRRASCDSGCTSWSLGGANMRQSLANWFSGESAAHTSAKDELCFDLYAQVAQDEPSHCVEDSTSLWTGAPLYRMGRITFDHARLMSPTKCEALRFNPFNSLKEHLPVALHRMRYLVYASSQKSRFDQALNGEDYATAEEVHYR